MLSISCTSTANAFLLLQYGAKRVETQGQAHLLISLLLIATVKDDQLSNYTSKYIMVQKCAGSDHMIQLPPVVTRNMVFYNFNKPSK
jgi:hypothetical protein